MTPDSKLYLLFPSDFGQMSSTFTQQAIRMDLSIGAFRVPAASLTLFDIVFILILVPLMDGLVYPALARCKRNPTQLQRMGNPPVPLSRIFFGLFTMETIEQSRTSLNRSFMLKRSRYHPYNILKYIFTYFSKTVLILS